LKGSFEGTQFSCLRRLWWACQCSSVRLDYN